MISVGTAALFNFQSERVLIAAVIRKPAIMATLGDNFRPDLFVDPDHVAAAVCLIETVRTNPAAQKRDMQAALAEAVAAGVLPEDAAKVIVGELSIVGEEAFHAGLLIELRLKRAVFEVCRQTMAKIETGDGHSAAIFKGLVEATKAVGETSPSFIEKRGDGEGGSPGRRAMLVRASDVVPAQVRYVWPGRIPDRKLTLLAGVPGAGKSFLAAFIAATISQGFPWPDSVATSTAAADVLMLLAEDDLADMVVPRLKANRADLARIHFIVGVQRINETTGETVEGLLNLSLDLAEVRRTLTENPAIRFIIIDTINSFLPSKVDSNSDVEVREILLPLVKLAEEMNVAILLISHTNKSASTSAITRVMGSTAFVGVARVAWLLSEDPENHDRKLFTPIKCNVARRPTALAFKIADDMQLEWEAEPLNMTADDALLAGGAKESKADSAVDWLRGQLGGGPVESEKMEAAARQSGLSHYAIREAKKSLWVKCGRRRGAFGGAFYWALPEHLDGEGKIVVAGPLEPSTTLNHIPICTGRSEDRQLRTGRLETVDDGAE